MCTKQFSVILIDSSLIICEVITQTKPRKDQWSKLFAIVINNPLWGLGTPPHTFNSSTQEGGRWISVSLSQPGLHYKFQDNLG